MNILLKNFIHRLMRDICLWLFFFLCCFCVVLVSGSFWPHKMWEKWGYMWGSSFVPLGNMGNSHTFVSSLLWRNYPFYLSLQRKPFRLIDIFNCFYCFVLFIYFLLLSDFFLKKNKVYWQCIMSWMF